jgi:hypothetical protein
MKLEPLLAIDQIKTGDILLIKDSCQIIPTTAKIVKVSDHDGTEVIINIELNKYFNVGMYLAGKSWAKEVFVVLDNPSNLPFHPKS